MYLHQEEKFHNKILQKLFRRDFYMFSHIQLYLKSYQFWRLNWFYTISHTPINGQFYVLRLNICTIQSQQLFHIYTCTYKINNYTACIHHKVVTDPIKGSALQQNSFILLSVKFRKAAMKFQNVPKSLVLITILIFCLGGYKIIIMKINRAKICPPSIFVDKTSPQFLCINFCPDYNYFCRNCEYTQNFSISILFC